MKLLYLFLFACLPVISLVCLHPLVPVVTNYFLGSHIRQGYDKTHLLVVVPGFLSLPNIHGTFIDGLADEQIYVYEATANIGFDSTKRGLRTQARDLVAEINRFLSHNEDLHRFTKISYLGTSLGGIVIRHALLQEKGLVTSLRKHAYISINSPHLGVPDRNSTFWIEAADWFNATELLKEMIGYQYPSFKPYPFERAVLIATQYDSTVSTSSALTELEHFHEQTVVTRKLVESTNWLDPYFSICSHSLATRSAEIIYNLRVFLSSVKNVKWMH